jgi:uncharacterized lipoprotein YajG
LPKSTTRTAIELKIAVKTIPGRAWAPSALLALGLGGCAAPSPNIVLQPAIPAVVPSTQENQITVSVTVGMHERRGSQYEEKGDKALIGDSEWLGIRKKDFWVEEPPETFIKRLLENDLQAWGFKVSAINERNQLRGRVNKFSLQGRSFEVDGVIDVDLEVDRADGTQIYKNHFVGTCTHGTAGPGWQTKDSLEGVFGACVEEFQKKIETDANLRTALSSN